MLYRNIEIIIQEYWILTKEEFNSAFSYCIVLVEKNIVGAVIKENCDWKCICYDICVVNRFFRLV